MAAHHGVLVYVEGGQRIGFGHVRRCLSLADAFRRLGADCRFFAIGEESVLTPIRDAGYDAAYGGSLALPAAVLTAAREHQARVVIADSYALDGDYLAALVTAESFIAVVDDLADRRLPVDVVVNGSAGAESLAYDVAPHTILLLGTQYMLLRPEFATAPQRGVAKSVRRVMITLGGADNHHLTPRLVAWTRKALPDAALDVVLGPLFTVGGEYERMGTSERLTLHHAPGDMRTLMLAADLAISAGGQTLYELAATGTPTIAVRVADNQTLNLTNLERAGTLVWCGDAHDAHLEERVGAAIMALAADGVRRAAMQRAGRQLVDGRGALRTAKAVLEASRKQHE